MAQEIKKDMILHKIALKNGTRLKRSNESTQTID